MKQPYYTKGVMGILMLLFSATASFAQFTISAPTAATTWESGKLCTITWTKTMQAPAKFNIRFNYQDGGMGLSEMLATDVMSADGAYSFILEEGKAPGKFYTICFEDANEMQFTCSELFTIKDADPVVSPFTLTAPTGSTKWEAGKTGTITWTSDPGAPADLGIRLDYINGGMGISYTVEESISSSTGMYVYSIPAQLSPGNYYQVCLTHAGSETDYTCSAIFTIQAPATGISETSSRIGDISVYPVPVTNESVLKFTLKERARVKVTLLDMLGKEVSCLRDEDSPAGAVDVSFSKPQQSGIYFLRIEAGEGSVTQKIVIN